MKKRSIDFVYSKQKKTIVNERYLCICCAVLQNSKQIMHNMVISIVTNLTIFWFNFKKFGKSKELAFSMLISKDSFD
jgi:hypothetical protein